MALTFADVGAEAAAQVKLVYADNQTLFDRWANMTIQDIHSRHDWYWTLDRTIVQTVIDKTAGTVSVSANGTTVTGSSTAFASEDVGKFIQFQGSNDWYKISTFNSASEIAIEIGYAGTTNLSAVTYKIRKFFYTLSGAEKLLDVMQASTYRPLKTIHFRDYDRRFPFSDTTGPTEALALYGVDSSGNLQFMIHPHADVAINLEVKYKKLATEDSLALFPAKWRHVVVDGVLARAWEYQALGNTEFDKGIIPIKRNVYESGITRMLRDAEPESDYHPVIRSSEVLNTPIGPRLPDGLSIPLDS